MENEHCSVSLMARIEGEGESVGDCIPIVERVEMGCAVFAGVDILFLDKCVVNDPIWDAGEHEADFYLALETMLDDPTLLLRLSTPPIP